MPEELIAQPPNGLTTPDDLWIEAAKDAALPAENLRIIAEVKWKHEDREAKRAFTRDMIACQQEIPHITKHGEIKNRAGGVQSRYARFEDIARVLKPIAARHGFAYRFLSSRSPLQNEVLIRIVVSHIGGHSEESELSVPRDDSGNKNAAQGSGSSFAYAKRHLLKGAFDIVEEGEDTDGNNVKVIASEQAMKLDTLLTALDDALLQADPAHKKGLSKQRFLTWMGVDKLSDIREKDFPRGLAQITARLNEARGKQHADLYSR